MANSDYIGRFGNTLRKLTALDRGGNVGQGGNFGAGPGAQQPALGMSQPNMGSPGAFGAGSGPVLPQAVAPADAAGAFTAPPAPGAPVQPALQPQQTPGKPPVGIGDILQQAKPEDLDQAAMKFEERGIDVDEKYGQLVESGKVKLDDKPDRREKGARLMEFGLRMMAASAQGADAFQAAGIAGMGLMESIQAKKDKATALAEKDRLEKRGDAKEAAKESTRVGERKEDKDARKAERDQEIEQKRLDREADAEQRRLDREARLKEEQLRASTDKKRNSQRLTDENGNVFMIDDDGKATPVMVKGKETRRGKRGGKTWEVEVEKQLKSAVKQDGTGVDRDTVMRAVGDRVKALKADGKLVRQLKAEGITDVENEISRRATRQVMDEYGIISGQSPAGGSSPAGAVVDFNSLP